MEKDFKKIKRKLRHLSKKEFSADSSEMISKIGDTYIVYNQYQIIPCDRKFKIYEKSKKLEYVGTAYNSSSAILWCVAKKSDEPNLAEKLLSYDNKVEFILHDILHAQQLLKVEDNSEKQQTLISRLNEYKFKHVQLNGKLHKYIKLAKHIKKLGLSHELKRTSKN